MLSDPSTLQQTKKIKKIQPIFEVTKASQLTTTAKKIAIKFSRSSGDALNDILTTVKLRSTC